MKKIIQMITVLVLVGLASGAALVAMYKYAHPQIELHKKKALDEAVYAVLPEARSYKVMEIEEKKIYKGFNSKNKPVGFAFVAKGGGYQGEIEIMVGVAPTLDYIKGIEILESVETPGLGGKITSSDFKSQFKGLSALPKIEYLKGKKPEKPNQIQAITGATVSSKSVVAIINKEMIAIKSILSEEK